jgi:lipid kinase YegS
MPVLKKPTKICLVLHKKSCTRPEVKAAIKRVQQSGIDVHVFIPWSRKGLRRFVRQAIKDGAQRIVAGGGDGTLNAVVNAMIRGDKRPKALLGILPLGTANDFAKGAGIDATDLTRALELACIGIPTKIDVGRMNDQYFINVASAGFGAEVTATTPQNMKKVLGGTAYSIMGFVRAFQLKPYEGRLILPDGVVQEGSMLIMAVGNSRFAGGGFEVAPQASLIDGLLDIAVVSGLPPESLDQLVGELKDPFNPRNEHLLYRQLPAFTIETGKPLHVNLDGEPIKGTHFEFRCCPEALSVVLGDTASRQ